ncbi:hypothetical protein Vadar_032968 [Vaccinium darrowii]|uniref:Uncharacterized protein n=1 Tax=Vaccinium darrowii TaxID=229202 RepID=A0ACB7Z821_9ERIC|nr:hypothetical protein Vadar_032968 [Vaccinium darrowii]
MSSSQTATSRGKNLSSARTKAQWDQPSKECFIHTCAEELGGASCKTGTRLTKVGDWELWQNLVFGESGLGRDPNTGAIAASDDWWDLKLMWHPECAKFREKPLPLEDEMRILFESNTATGEHKYTPSSGILPGVRNSPLVDCDNIDALLDNDDEILELVHPTESQKKRRMDSSATKKAKGKKGSAMSRLEACLQQICDSTDSASSPFVRRAAVDIPTLKECADKLSELPEFNEDPALWAQAYNLFGGAKHRAMFMACPDDLKKYHWITPRIESGAKSRARHHLAKELLLFKFDIQVSSAMLWTGRSTANC